MANLQGGSCWSRCVCACVFIVRRNDVRNASPRVWRLVAAAVASADMSLPVSQVLVGGLSRSTLRHLRHQLWRKLLLLHRLLHRIQPCAPRRSLRHRTRTRAMRHMS